MRDSMFQITTTFAMGDGSMSLCDMSLSQEPQEFFDRLKQGFLQWRRSLSNSMHSLSVFVPVARREEPYRDLIQSVCALWNSDPDIATVGPSHIELSLTNRGDGWIGCTTAKDFIRKMHSEQGEMHFLDYAVLLRDLEAQRRKAEKDEKARRRANPVQVPVELPANIKSEIARYLRLEYGESARDKDSVKARDLKFDGEFVIDGVPTQFWRYPSSNPKKPQWATVERLEQMYCLGMTGDPPPKG